ncbi:hypothetical protein SDC9_182041 [bioreactor metagenome]|uniref:Uncharacterized protein n=1 Tax=bioreactor metagenome TaxID=1076179 RepID=A0A645H693_9ZZZZ
MPSRIRTVSRPSRPCWRRPVRPAWSSPPGPTWRSAGCRWSCAIPATRPSSRGGPVISRQRPLSLASRFRPWSIVRMAMCMPRVIRTPTSTHATCSRWVKSWRRAWPNSMRPTQPPIRPDWRLFPASGKPPWRAGKKKQPP